MKIIDEKGRLFGKINIIDLTVLLVLIFFVPSVYFGYKMAVAKKYEAKEKWVTVDVRLSNLNPPELCNILKKGDVETDPIGGEVGKLNEIKSNKASDVLVLTDNKFINVSHPFQRDIVLNLSVSCVEKDDVLYYKNYPVKIGNMVTFSTSLYSVSGLIIGMKIN